MGRRVQRAVLANLRLAPPIVDAANCRWGRVCSGRLCQAGMPRPAVRLAHCIQGPLLPHQPMPQGQPMTSVAHSATFTNPNLRAASKDNSPLSIPSGF